MGARGVRPYETTLPVGTAPRIRPSNMEANLWHKFEKNFRVARPRFGKGREQNSPRPHAVGGGWGFSQNSPINKVGSPFDWSWSLS